MSAGDTSGHLPEQPTTSQTAESDTADTQQAADVYSLGQRGAADPAQSADELKEERRKIRRLQLMMNVVLSTIGQDPSLTVDEAAELVANSRRAALAMFPDKELAYNLIYKPRIQRLMRERYHIQ